MMRKSTFRSLILCAALLCGALNAWAGHSGTHHSKAIAETKGNGKVYVTSSYSYQKKAIWSGTNPGEQSVLIVNCGGDNANKHDAVSVTFQAEAVPGYEFAGWSDNSNATSWDKNDNIASIAIDNDNGGKKESEAKEKSHKYGFFVPVFHFSASVANTLPAGCSAYAELEASKVVGTAIDQASASTNVTFRADKESSNYQFDGWYSDEAMSKLLTRENTYSQSMANLVPGSTESLSLYAKFVEELTPIFELVDGANLLKVGDSKNLVEMFSLTYAPSVVYTLSDNDNVVALSDDGTRLVALNAGTAKLTLTQAAVPSSYISTATQDFEIRVELVDNPWTIPETSSLFVEDEWIVPAINRNSDGVISATSSDPTLAYYDVESGKIVAQNTSAKSFDEADVTITIAQAATYKFTDISNTIVVTVKKHDNIIKINGQENYAVALGYNSQSENFVFTSSNDNVNAPALELVRNDGGPMFTHELTFDEPYVTSSVQVGSASWTISQAEDYKYKAGSTQLLVSVDVAAAGECYVLEEKNSHNVSTYTNNKGFEYTLSDPGSDLYVELAKKSWATTQTLYIYGYDANGNQTTIASYDPGDLSTTLSEKHHQIGQNIVKIKIQAGGTEYKTFANLRVTRYTYLNVSQSELTIDQNDSNQPLMVGEQGSTTFYVDWSVAGGGNLNLVSGNPLFTVSPSVIEHNGCEDGRTEVTVTYHGDQDQKGTASTEIIIYNDWYNASVSVDALAIHQTNLKNGFAMFYNDDDVTLDGTTKAYTAHWSLDNSLSLRELETEDAVPAATPVLLHNASANFYTYTVEENNTLAAVSGNAFIYTSLPKTVDPETECVFVLYNLNGEMVFYKFVGTVPQGKVVLLWEGVSADVAPVALRFEFEESTEIATALIPIWDQPNQFAEDGKIYTIMGLEVGQPTAPGFYIQNGKKFFVR